MTTTLLVALALAQGAPAEAPADRAALRLLTDGKRHYLAFDPAKGYAADFFYGTAKALAKVRVKGGGAVGDEQFDVALWDPRIISGVTGYASLSMRGKGASYELQCGKKVTPLTVVPPAEAGPLLSAASFTAPSWTRLPERLLRDDKGTYYFVDRLRTEDTLDRRDFRLFVGPKGRMALLPLKDVVDDSEGMIFSTQKGDLRLVANRSASPDKPPMMKWVAGRSELPLVEVPLDEPRNVRLVYLELGPYDGQRLGTPCDDAM